MRDHSTASHQIGDLVGTIRHRLLVNRWVDPDEVTPQLPDGLRPHVGSSGVVVGCCLVAIEEARPWPLPAAIGSTIYAAAHRISVEIGPPDAVTTAVYVPMRHSDSRPTVAIGGRLFPGVHRRSGVTVDSSDSSLDWEVQPTGPQRRADTADHDFGIAVTALRDGAKPTDSEVAAIVIGTVLGISPDHSGRMEGVEMRPASTSAQEVALIELQSDFLESFSSAEEAETLLMTDVEVTWRRAPIDLTGISAVATSAHGN